ncbi:MAG: YggT family protein [Patescibacteria group bacterium]
MDSSTSPSTQPLYRGTQIVWYVLGVLEALLLFRFVFRLLGANPDAGFTHFIYSVTYIFAAPFLNVFKSTRIEGSVFEWTTLLAMAVYGLIAWGLMRMFVMGRTVSTPEAAIKLKEQDA